MRSFPWMILKTPGNPLEKQESISQRNKGSGLLEIQLGSKKNLSTLAQKLHHLEQLIALCEHTPLSEEIPIILLLVNLRVHYAEILIESSKWIEADVPLL
jgi:hypothetical protein